MKQQSCIIIWCFLVILFTGELAAQDDALQIFARAEHLRKSNSFIAAIDEFDRAIALEPENPRFYFSKGTCYMRLKDFDNAVMAFEKTAELKNDLVAAYTMLATCYKEMDRFIKVEESLDKAFKYETDVDKRTSYKQAIISMLYELDKFDMALRHINEIKVVNQKVPQILYYEASIQNRKGNFEAAKKAMLAATEMLPSKDPRVVAKYYYELGYAHNKLGEYEASSEAFKYADVGPFRSLIAKLSPQFYASAAIAYMKIYDFKKSRELLATSLKMKQDYSHAHVMLATIEQMEADKSEAIAELRHAASKEKDSSKLSRIYQQMAMLLLENGKYNEAIEASRKHQQLDDKNYEVIFIEAVSLVRLNNTKQAVSVMERLVNFAGLDIETRAKYEFMLALIYKDMGNAKLAKASFKHAQAGLYKTLASMELEEIEKEEEALAKKQQVTGS